MSKLKGKAVVAQSGGCTAVINQSLAGVIEEARRHPEITGVLGSRHGITGVLNGEWADFRKIKPAVIRQIANLPSAALGSSRHKLQNGEAEKIVGIFKAKDVRYLFLAGGNDTAETILKIAHCAENMKYDMRVIHIPKTIDNDLMETDHCPGFGSVARFAAIATQEAGLDTRAMKRVDPVKMIEFMGRNAGWITAASGLLKKKELDPPHIIWIPEVPFEEGRFLGLVEYYLKKAGCCVVALSETIRDSRGEKIGRKRDGIAKDPFGHAYVEGASVYLTRLVEERFKIRARYDKPGTIQRMSMPYISPVDQKEAYEAGTAAVKWAVNGASKVMVAFRRKPGKTYRISYVPVPLEKIPHRERLFPGPFFNRKTMMVTPAFRRYALPLLGRKLPEFRTL